MGLRRPPDGAMGAPIMGSMNTEREVQTARRFKGFESHHFELDKHENIR